MAASIGRDLRAAFPASPVPSESCLFTGNRYKLEPEMLELFHRLRGKKWSDVAIPSFRIHEAMVLLTGEAFIYYLPAYIENALRFVNNPEDPTLSYTAYTLFPFDGKAVNPRREELFLKLDSSQKRAIFAFLQLVAQIRNDRTVRSAVEYWKGIAA
jgi:hypothetical protein